VSGLAWSNFVSGDRVVLRLLADNTETKRFTDLIGIIEKITESGILLQLDAAGYDRRADAKPKSVWVPLSSIYIGKKIPPRPSKPQRGGE
jgi:hypothetical protein